jgi:hypothetical protein
MTICTSVFICFIIIIICFIICFFWFDSIAVVQAGDKIAQVLKSLGEMYPLNSYGSCRCVCSVVMRQDISNRMHD